LARAGALLEPARPRVGHGPAGTGPAHRHPPYGRAVPARRTSARAA